MAAGIKIPNKELRKVVDGAVRRGWTFEPGGKHPLLRNGGHRITVALSPSDKNAHLSMGRRVRACEAGTCEHGKPSAVVVTGKPKPTRKAARTATGPEPAKVTTAEAAEMLGVGKTRVQQLAAEGKLARHGWVGVGGARQRTYLRSQVEALVRARGGKGRLPGSGGPGTRRRKAKATVPAPVVMPDPVKPTDSELPRLLAHLELLADEMEAAGRELAAGALSVAIERLEGNDGRA